MAIYNRTNSTSTATAATVPSMDLGSIIVTSLQNAVESMQGEDKDTSLKDTIKQGIEDSAVIKAIQTSSSKLSSLFSNKSNTEAKKTKETPSDKVMSAGLEKLLKANTDPKKEKDTPADKMEKEMAELLQITKDDKKKEKANESKVKQEQRKEKEHKTTIKEGFSAVKAVGASIIKNILLILVAVQLVAEIIVLLKYAWHYLMGVFIPNTWTKIKLAWTGFWTKITTELRNFFVGLFAPIFRKFGVDIGLSDEQKKRKAEIEQEFATNPKLKSMLDKYVALSEEKKTETQKLEQIKQVFHDTGNVNMENKIDEIIQKVQEGKGGVKADLQSVQTFAAGIQQSLRDRGDFGAADKLDAILTEDLNNWDLATKQREVDNLKNDPDYINNLRTFKEYQQLLKGQVDVDAAVFNAQKELMKADYEAGKISEAESEALLNDKKYKNVVSAAFNEARTEMGNNFKYEQDDKHEKWIKEYGEPWKESIKTMVNDLTRNIGINLQIGEKKTTPNVNDQNPNTSSK